MTASSSTFNDYDSIPPPSSTTNHNIATDAHWFFTKEQLDQTPSRRAGFDADKELFYRQQTASFIQEMGSKLQLTSTCICTAIVYAHRFYVFHSFQRFSRNDIASAALFLAAKAQECPRKLEYVVKVAYALQHRDEPALEIKSDKYLEEAQKIITYENILLQTLGFEIEIDLPHSHVVRYIQRVKGLTTPNKDLAQAAYFFATDILHVTSFCLRYRPSVVACVCIHLACNWAKWEIPEHENKPWYYYVDPTVTKESIEALSHEFTDVCAKSPMKIKRYIGRRPFPAGVSTGDASVANSHDDGGSHSSMSFNPSPVPTHNRPVSICNAPIGVAANDSKQRSMNDSFLSPGPAFKSELKNEKLTPDLSLSPSVKKQNLDLNRYKERREKEKEATFGTASTSSVAVAPPLPSSAQPPNPPPPPRSGDHHPPLNATRKSFMPVTTSTKDSYNDGNLLNKSTSKLYVDHPPSFSESGRKAEHRSNAAVVAGPDQHRHHPSDHRHSGVLPGASSTDHRHGRPSSSSNDIAGHHPPSSGDPSRKRPPPAPISDSGPPSKISKVDHKDGDRDAKPDHHQHHHRSQTKEARPKDRPSSSSQPSYRLPLPPLPKPETNDEINKAILSELGTGTA